MATAQEIVRKKTGLAIQAGLKAVVEKYELPAEAFNVFTYYFQEEMDKPVDEEEDVPNTSTLGE